MTRKHTLNLERRRENRQDCGAQLRQIHPATPSQIPLPKKIKTGSGLHRWNLRTFAPEARPVLGRRVDQRNNKGIAWSGKFGKREVGVWEGEIKITIKRDLFLVPSILRTEVRGPKERRLASDPV